MPNLTVSPAVDGTWVCLTAPDGTKSYFATPLDLWHAIVSQPGFFDAASLGLVTTSPLDPSQVRPERLRIHAVAARCERNSASLRACGIRTSGLPQAPAKPTKLRVPKWAREPAGPPVDAETAEAL